MNPGRRDRAGQVELAQLQRLQRPKASHPLRRQHRSRSRPRRARVCPVSACRHAASCVAALLARAHACTGVAAEFVAGRSPEDVELQAAAVDALSAPGRRRGSGSARRLGRPPARRRGNGAGRLSVAQRLTLCNCLKPDAHSTGNRPSTASRRSTAVRAGSTSAPAPQLAGSVERSASALMVSSSRRGIAPGCTSGKPPPKGPAVDSRRLRAGSSQILPEHQARNPRSARAWQTGRRNNRRLTCAGVGSSQGRPTRQASCRQARLRN